MNELKLYLSNNLPLFAIAAIIFFIAFRNLRVRKKESILFIIFISVVLFLSVVVEMEKYAQKISDIQGGIVLGTIFTSIGYITRPVLLFVFILLSNMDQKRSKTFYLICLIPLGINFIIYLLPLFMNVPALQKLVFYYRDSGLGTAVFTRGTVLNFTSHFFSLLYLGVLIYVSTIRFHGKHRRDGLVIILCVAIIAITVIVEVLIPRNDLLNVVCGICAMINYIFIMSVNTSRDPLTGLYDRRTYYEDISRFKELINGVVQIDMNELKRLNDYYGHDEGDKALNELAAIFESNVERNTMCVYRLSGDEFLILMFNGKEETLLNTVFAIKEQLRTSSYSAAIGYYFINKKADKMTFEQAMKKAEDLMYEDKEKYYNETGHDRRKES